MTVAVFEIKNRYRDKFAFGLGVAADPLRKSRHGLNQLCEFIFP